MNQLGKKDNLLKEMDLRIILPALTCVLVVAGYCVVNAETALTTFTGIFDTFVIKATSLYLWYPLILLGIGIFFICSKYGNIVLGDPTEKPTTTTWQYVAILLAMAFGATIMRTGPINWALAAQDPPAAFGIEAFSKEAMIFGNSYSMYAWGFSLTFSIFALAAPAIGYYLHVRKRSSLKLSAILSELFGTKFATSILGKLVDLLFVFAFVAASTTLVGLATPVVTSLLAHLMGVEPSLGLEIFLTIVMVVIFTISACLGLKKGIERLSEINLYLASGLIIAILLLGPILFILDFFTDTFGHYLANFFTYAFHANSMGDGTADYVQSYSVFWVAYNAGWAIMHSSFLAIVSKGRTIRQMLTIYYLCPQIIVVIFTAVLGGLGVNTQLTGEVPVFDLLSTVGVGDTVAAILDTLPLAFIVIAVYLVTSMIFLSTTMDSTTYTIASYVTLRDLRNSEPSRALRLLFAAIIAILAISMQVVGGLAPLDVINGMLGIPIIIFQGLVIATGFKMMNEDKAFIYNVRKSDAVSAPQRISTTE